MCKAIYRIVDAILRLGILGSISIEKENKIFYIVSASRNISHRDYRYEREIIV